MSFVVSLFDWLNEESEDDDADGAGAATATAPQARYAASSKALDAVAVTLSAEEYNHIASINVKTMEADTAHLELLRQTQDRLDRAQIPLPGASDPGYEIHDWLAAVLAPCPEPCVSKIPKSTRAMFAAPLLFEPAPVMLDGTTAAALASAQSQLSEDEYNHILNVQRQLAELELEAEMETARKLMSVQPGGGSSNFAAPRAAAPSSLAPSPLAPPAPPAATALATPAAQAAGAMLTPAARASAAGTGRLAGWPGLETATPGLPRPGYNAAGTPMALPADSLAAPGAEATSPTLSSRTGPGYSDLFGFTPKR